MAPLSLSKFQRERFVDFFSPVLAILTVEYVDTGTSTLAAIRGTRSTITRCRYSWHQIGS